VDFQVLFNVAMGFIMTLFGWFLRVSWDALSKLQEQDRELADKVAKIELKIDQKADK